MGDELRARIDDHQDDNKFNDGLYARKSAAHNERGGDMASFGFD